MMKATKIYITSESGMLVAEVNGEKMYELYDAIYELGMGFGDSVEVEFDMGDERNDVWGLIDALYEQAA